MEGMFKANGGCGYVKKPDFLLNVGENNEIFNPQDKLPVKIILRVRKNLTKFANVSVFPPILKL